MKFKYLFIAITVLSAYLIALFWALPDGKLHVKVLDIGQGDSILIQTPLGKNILVDGGMGVAVLERLNEEMNFFDRTFDAVLLTHPDADHMDGLVEVVKRYDVKKFLLTGVSTDKPTYIALLEELERKNIPTDFVDGASDYLIEPEVILDILSPLESFVGKVVDDANTTSIVARLLYGDTAVMLTGDANTDNEMDLLRAGLDVRADLLKAGHHGSKTSSGEMFLRAVDPEVSLISAGVDNSFGHPSREVVERMQADGIAVVSTQDVGTIRYVSNGEDWVQD
jgi:competence protein ComEC